MDCKEALAAADGDFEKAIDYLRKKGMSAATKRSSKAAKDGTVASYIHMGGKIGVMVEVNCQKRILWPRRRIFKAWPGTLPCMWRHQIRFRARRRNLGGNAGTRKIHLPEQLTAEKKPEKIWDKIIEGKLKNITKRCVSSIRSSLKIQISPWEHSSAI